MTRPNLKLAVEPALPRGRGLALGTAAAGILLAGLTTLGAVLAANTTSTTAPLIDLASEPLYMNGAKTKANLTLALSVEFPTVGQTYRDEFDPTKAYIGYFDNKVCYTYNATSGANLNYFDWTNKVPDATGDCKGGGFNGNFMNWATSSAIDIMRYGLTGGNRVVDEGSGSSRTIVERAFLPTDFYKSSAYFSQKYVPNALAKKLLEQPAVNALGNSDLYIYNCKNRVYFAKSADTTGGCDNPFNVANAGAAQLIGPGSQQQNNKFYEVRNLVCDPSSATNRLMTYDPTTKRWRGLCLLYPNGKYKPVGQFQVNAESLRVSVFGYLIDSTQGRYGGVLRAPMKYLGPKNFDKNFNLLPTANAAAEWDANTGVFIANPQTGDANYGNQGYTRSGAIQYINKFGTLDSTNTNYSSTSIYKGYDPLGELYYESVRYLQGKQPTSQAVSGMTDTNKERFPAYSQWVDPFAGFEDATGSGTTCLRNSILTIGDVFTWNDWSLPGNTRSNSNDFTRAADINPDFDAVYWTNVIGSFESNGGMSYTDSQGRTQTASNIAGNTLYSGLANAGSLLTGAGTGSYLMAGLAYWANTHSFRTDLPKGRITTFGIDVNERNQSADVDFRHTRQIYLAAKYGGFDDSQAGNTGNPYAPSNNLLWQGSGGSVNTDAKNYFLVSDAQKFLDSISDVFAKVVQETGSVAGGAVSTQRLQNSESGAVFQARFNPVANYWSGKLLRYETTLSADGQSITLASTPTWEAGEVLTNAVATSSGLNGRNIVIGSPIGQQGTVLPTPFKWANLAQAFKDAYSVTGQVDTNNQPILDTTLGQKRLEYLRGSRADEISASNPTGLFRPRDYVLGDIVNSALVYKGKPALGIVDADYPTFYDNYVSRVPVVYVNANDGMLHAFKASDGSEAFAYVPGFVGPKLSVLTNQLYAHTYLNDAPPAVAEAKIGTSWKTVLVSGVGGGSQGVYALDVTDPTSFTKDNVLWEFTDRDSPELGNVIGTPRIVKLRATSDTSGNVTYKWYAVFASGINNYANDGYASTNGNGSIFILDLSTTPTPTTPWQEGVNFWRIELPQSLTTIAKGAVGVATVNNSTTGAVDYLYTGDLQGNVWAFNMGQTLGTGASQRLWSVAELTTNGVTNGNVLSDLKTGSNVAKPLFTAQYTTGTGNSAVTNRQPITTTPLVSSGLDGNFLVSVGTGKFLETSDLTVPMPVTASFYTLLHQRYAPNAITGQSQLQLGTVNATTGVVTVPTFTYGYPSTNGSTLKMGWYINLDASIGERQISTITNINGRLVFSTLYPTRGACGEGGGRIYNLGVLDGNGFFYESTVGVLAAPLVINVGTIVGKANAEGGRWAYDRLVVIMQGSKGMDLMQSNGQVTTTNPDGSTSTSLGKTPIMQTDSRRVGDISWRQINNYKDTKNAP